MKLTKWILICIVLLGGVAAAQFALIFSLKSEVSRAREKSERLSDKFAEIAFEAETGLGDRKNPDDKALKNLEVKLISALRRIDALEAGEAGSKNLDEAIDQRLAEKMNHRATENAMLAGLGQTRGPGFRRIPIGSLSNRLELNEGQKSQFEDAIARVQEGMLEISKIGKNEDQEFINELNAMVRTPGRPIEKNQKIREKLSSQNLPGSNKTYLEALTELRANAFSDMESIFTADQMERFRQMRVSIFNIGISQLKEE